MPRREGFASEGAAASASKWGDYFTGGDGSTLVIDEFSLEYDY